MRNVELLVTALECIEQHLSDDIRTEDLAAACFCSRSTLEKLFRSAFHISVHDYVVRRRMMRAAKELTEQPRKSILAIAMEYGYSTHESFARAFGQVWNCKPSEFRKRKYTELFPRFRIIPESRGGCGMRLKNMDISELYDLFQERNGCYFVCCDIRHMMRINQISHKAGDIAILEAMERMDRAAGDEDVVFRIGGNEFCILTNSREQAYAEDIVETIKAKNGKTYPFEEREIPLTLYVTAASLEKSMDSIGLYKGLSSALQEEREKYNAERSHKEKDYAERSHTEKGHAEKSRAEKDYAERNYAEKDHAEKSHAEKSHVEGLAERNREERDNGGYGT